VRVDGAEHVAERVHTDRALDLVLAKATVPGVPVTWAIDPLKTGHWVTSVSSADEAVKGEMLLKVGVVSAASRPIHSGGAAMGIRMSNADDGEAVRIVDISLESPANDAGLRAGDMILEINGKVASSSDTVRSIIKGMTPGDEVRVRFRRGQKDEACQVRLASLSRVKSNFTGEDYGNGGVSLRTDGFPMVLEHATPLKPADMGGALYSLKGDAVGINISRVDRVTTFALPASLFWTKVQDWISQHREQSIPSKP
jgi:S1-C subfamily serine protease